MRCPSRSRPPSARRSGSRPVLLRTASWSGLAVLNLLSEVAEGEPLLCIVDDAHWLDEASAQVLAFVARRLAAERLALLLCVRDPTDDGDLRPLRRAARARLTGLGESDARTLLAAAVRAPLDDEVRDRIIVRGARQPPRAARAAPQRAADADWRAASSCPTH